MTIWPIAGPREGRCEGQQETHVHLKPIDLHWTSTKIIWFLMGIHWIPVIFCEHQLIPLIIIENISKLFGFH